MANPPDNVANPPDVVEPAPTRDHLPGYHTAEQAAGKLANTCDICGFTYFDAELTLRNGLRVCTIAREKSQSCFDESGYKDTVTVRPYVRPVPTLTRRTRFQYHVVSK